MKITKTISDALNMVFNSRVVLNMSENEYQDYINNLLILAIEVNRASNGKDFVEDFVSASLSNPPQFEIMRTSEKECPSVH